MKAKTIRWQNMPGDLHLLEGEVHLFWGQLNLPGQDFAGWESHLSAEELQRLKLFSSTDGGRRFARSHGLLRQLLGGYLGIKPAEVLIENSAKGKPGLGGRQVESGVQFNLSHTGEQVLIGFCKNKPIGVDLEQVRPPRNLQRLAARYFSAGEQATLAQLSGEQQLQAFFTCWTGKEAFLKCLGEGLSYGLARFEVEIDPERPLSLVQVGGDVQGGRGWQLECFAVGEQHLGALAVQSDHKLDVRYFSALP